MKDILFKISYILFIIALGILIASVFGIIDLPLVNLPVWVSITLVTIFVILSSFLSWKDFKAGKKYETISNSIFIMVFLILALASRLGLIDLKPASPLITTLIKIIGGVFLTLYFLVLVISLPSLFKKKKENI